MAFLDIQALFTAPTSDQIRAQMVTNLVALGVPADQWKPGGVASTILTVEHRNRRGRVSRIRHYSGLLPANGDRGELTALGEIRVRRDGATGHVCDRCGDAHEFGRRGVYADGRHISSQKWHDGGGVYQYLGLHDYWFRNPRYQCGCVRAGLGGERDTDRNQYASDESHWRHGKQRGEPYRYRRAFRC